ncbi:MAG TPA: hypothetical protein VGI42_06090 [Chthoniobacterales bacterium]
MAAALLAATSVYVPGMLFGAPEKRIDLAAVISPSDAASALGEPVKDAQSRNSEETDGYYSRCNYYSQNPGKSLVLRIRQAAAAQLEPRKQLEELSATNGKMKTINGLGEKAALLNDPAGNGVSNLMLYVAKGNAFVTVGLGGIDDEKVALEKARALARKILAQL